MNLVCVTSGKGGTGKSCVAAYTGIALSEGGKKTLLMEQGSTAKSLDVIVAAQNEAVFDIVDVLAGRCEPEKAIVPATLTDKLFLLPCGAAPYTPAKRVQMLALLKTLRKEYDYILVDGVDFAVIPPDQFDCVMVVTTPDTLSVRACQNHVRELFDSGAENVRLVINNVPSQVIPIHGCNDFDDVINTVGAQLIAVVPQSPKLQFSSNNAEPLDEESITIQVFDNLAARLRGLPRPLLIH